MAQKYVPEHICAFNKTGIGLAISQDIPKPDAVIYTTTPCDSARIAYPLIAEYLNCRSLLYRQTLRRKRTRL